MNDGGNLARRFSPTARWLLVLPLLLGLLLLYGCTRGTSPSKLDDGTTPIGTGGGSTSGTKPPTLTPEMIASNNRGVGLMEKYEYEEAQTVFGKLVVDYPNWLDVKVNLGIAVLNFTQKGAEAVPFFAEVVTADPDHIEGNYCLGLAMFHAGETKTALPHFQKVVKLDPHDPHALYFVARCIELERPEEATEWYLKALALEPAFVSAHYRCFDLLRGTGKQKEANAHMAEFALLRESPLSVVFEYTYTLMGSKAMVIRVAGPKPAPAKVPRGPVFAAAAALAGGEGLKVAAGASLTTCDLDADGRQDLFLAGAATGGGNAVLIAGDNGGFTSVPKHPLAAVTGVAAALWGDFDNDGLLDVYLCRQGPNQLWRQTTPGEWKDVTAASKSGGGNGDTIDGVFLDLDHDADLDLLLVNRGAAPQLLNNNRNGTFSDTSDKLGLARDATVTAAVVVADLDGDRDLDLLLLDTPGKDPRSNVLLVNDREGRYHAEKSLGSLKTTSIAAAVAIDANADGQVELYTAEGGSLARWQRAIDGAWTRQPLSTGSTTGVLGDGVPRLAVVDVTGDGVPELLCGTTGWSAWKIPTDLNSGSLQPVADSGEHEPLSAWTPVLLDDAAGPSVVAATLDGPPLAWAAGTGRHQFLSVSLTGKKKGAFRERSNASGLGNCLLARIGGRTVRADSLPAVAAPGQSLQPVAVGLGGAAKADYVKVVWTEGVTQGWLDLEPGQRHKFEEWDWQPTSCPVLFAWDGTSYRFVSDVLAVGGLGFPIGPGRYAVPDPTENFLLPAALAQPHEGRYRLKLTEPMPELTYLDAIGLVAWDLPAGWQMTLDERLATGGPEPSGRPIFFRSQQRPLRVINDRQADVTARVANVDHEAADVGPLDKRFLGRLAGEHVLVLEFEQPLDSGDGRPVLLADGWVEFPFSQTVYSAWQAGAGFDPPTLEARDSQGLWVPVARSFGYPGGMPRQIALPLENLPPGTRALRLRTNLEIYWDRLTIVRAEPCPQAVRRELPLAAADLRESGFTVREVKEQFRPEFDYEFRYQRPDLPDPEGFYTRFGKVDELVRTTDDAVAIFGPGEEIHLEFTAPGAEVETGWTRRLVLELVGWCKDMDLYTKNGATVAPLPGTGKPATPRDRLHRKYNTRYQRGW